MRGQARLLARAMMEQVRTEALLDADPAAGTRQAVIAAQQRLVHLKGPGSKWVQALNDASSDIANASSFQFRAAMRDLGQGLDRRVELLSSPEDWDSFAAALQRDLAAAVAAVFDEVDAGFARLRGRLYEMVAEEMGAERGSRALVDRRCGILRNRAAGRSAGDSKGYGDDGGQERAIRADDVRVPRATAARGRGGAAVVQSDHHRA